jgi:hypothetical protein
LQLLTQTEKGSLLLRYELFCVVFLYLEAFEQLISPSTGWLEVPGIAAAPSYFDPNHGISKGAHTGLCQFDSWHHICFSCMPVQLVWCLVVVIGVTVFFKLYFDGLFSLQTAIHYDSGCTTFCFIAVLSLQSKGKLSSCLLQLMMNLIASADLILAYPLICQFFSSTTPPTPVLDAGRGSILYQSPPSESVICPLNTVMMLSSLPKNFDSEC